MLKISINYLKKYPKLFKFVKNIVTKIKKIGYKYGKGLIKVDEKMVIFDSFLGKGYSCNPRAIYEEMINQSKFDDWKFVWVMRKPSSLQLDRGEVVRYNSLKHFYYLAKSKYWIFNSKTPAYMYKKSNQVYLQTWHGTPLKKLARDIEIGEDATFYRTKMSKDDMVKTYDQDVEKYDYLISPNEYSTEKFISAFGVGRDKIIETGYPRNDILTNYNKELVENIKNGLGIDDSKKVILYAPTWRDNVYDVKGYSFTPKVDFKKWREVLGDDYFIIYKPHYLIVNNIDQEGLEDFIYFSKATDSINELYLASDLLITDYSSVFFDYSILKRPMLFYMFDLDDYDENIRGFYIDINDLPGPIIQDEDILLRNIKDLDTVVNTYKIKQERFTQQICYLEDGHASERVVDLVFG